MPVQYVSKNLPLSFDSRGSGVHSGCNKFHRSNIHCHFEIEDSPCCRVCLRKREKVPPGLDLMLFIHFLDEFKVHGDTLNMADLMPSDTASFSLMIWARRWWRSKTRWRWGSRSGAERVRVSNISTTPHTTSKDWNFNTVCWPRFSS